MNKSAQLVIVDGIRTPFSKMTTELAALHAVEIGRTAVTALLGRTGIDPAIVDEVIMGNVSQPADAANIARVIALRSGFPNTTPAFTVHRNCASGLEALTTAACKAAAGQGSIFVVGGVESMTRIPLLFRADAAEKFAGLARAKSAGAKLKALSNFRASDLNPQIGLKLGLTDPVAGMNMGQTAEVLAREFDISREDQDQFALQSHLKATAAREQLAEEITPAYSASAPDGVATQDNGIREQQTMEALAKLKAVFERNTGTVTPGNASQITDGGCALLVMTEAAAKKHGLTPVARLIDFHYSGCAPERMGLGPAHAMAAIAKRQKLLPEKTDLIEINEAFAAQVIAVQKLFKDPDFAKAEGGAKGLGEIPDELLNPNGGSIALGHPVGATGARLMLTAIRQLQRKKSAKKAYISLCIGGGQGGAALIEKI